MLIVSLRPGSRKLTAVAEIRVHRHTRRGVRPPRFAWYPDPGSRRRLSAAKFSSLRSNGSVAPRRRVEPGAGLCASRVGAAARGARTPYGCDNLTASSTNAEALYASDPSRMALSIMTKCGERRLRFCSKNAAQDIFARVSDHGSDRRVNFPRYFGAQIDHSDTNRKQSLRLCGC